MQIVLHAGAHFTDDDRLLKSLGKNRELLASQGVSLPKPRSYRTKIRTLLHDSLIDANARAEVLSDLKDPSVDEPDRIVFSNSNFFCVPRLAIRNNTYYPRGEERLQDFCSIFYSDEVEIFFAIRNPATLLPALVDGSPDDRIEDITGGSDPAALRWSEMIQRVRTALPNASLTVWCNEDTPLIWEQLLREISGIEPTQPLEGGNDLLHEIMSVEGLKRFDAYVEKHPGLTEMQKRRVIAAFLDKFAIEEELEEELDIPGWSEEVVDTLTEIYDEDVFEISRIPGVTFISP
ncbi:MAG: hypothetical protein OQK00_12055 [Rhodobacteraceae bacterium]|nr:hypothetical protein [Paracoccaceae bacterium]MCW9043841.1 hypothetical protein [Pseudopelagicola sp.]